jgi:hypothetical protein
LGVVEFREIRRPVASIFRPFRVARRPARRALVGFPHTSIHMLFDCAALLPSDSDFDEFHIFFWLIVIFFSSLAGFVFRRD